MNRIDPNSLKADLDFYDVAGAKVVCSDDVQEGLLVVHVGELLQFVHKLGGRCQPYELVDLQSDSPPSASTSAGNIVWDQGGALCYQGVSAHLVNRKAGSRGAQTSRQSF